MIEHRQCRLAWIVRVLPCVMAFGSLLANQPSARAADAVERFQAALEQDVELLPPEDDKDRAAVRKSMLDKRRKTLTELSKELVSLYDLSRTLRLRDSVRLRDKKNKDLPLSDVDRDVFDTLLPRFVAEYRKGIESKDPTVQQALAVLAGDLVTNIYMERRSQIGGMVVRELLPQLAALSKSTEPGVQEAVVRALGNIILELREALDAKSMALVRESIGNIQKSSHAIARRAVVDAADALVRLLNPNPGEESIQPRIVLRRDLIDILNLAPVLFEGMRDRDAAIRQSYIAVLHRLTSLLARDRQLLIVTPALAATPADVPPKEEEMALLKANQEMLRRELEDYRKGVEPFNTHADTLERLLEEGNREARYLTLQTLEELAVLQGHVRDRTNHLAMEKKEDKALQAGMLLDPLFERVNGQLLRALEDDAANLRLMALQVLESRGPQAQPALAAIQARLTDTSPFVRWVAVRTLGRFQGINNPAVIDGIAGRLVDDDLSVRIAAAVALEGHGAAALGAEEQLRKVVNSGDAEFREAALRALGRVGKNGKANVPVMARELSHTDVRVRRAAALAIGAFGADVALAKDQLLAALEDEDAEVRRYASEALLAIPGKKRL